MSIEQSEQNANECEQSIFEKQAGDAINQFEKACLENEIKTAIAIIVNPKTNQPTIFCIGHLYDVSSTLAFALRGMKSQLLTNLDVG